MYISVPESSSSRRRPPRAAHLVGAIVVAVTVNVSAQVVPLTTPSQFSGTETVIDFEGFASGTLLTNHYAAQGVTFSVDAGGPLAFTTDSVLATPRQFGPSGDGAARNPGLNNPILSFSASIGPGLNVLVGSEIRIPIMPRSPRCCGVTSICISWPLRRMVRSMRFPELREIASVSCDR